MPTVFESEIEIGREELTVAVRLAGVFARETAGIIKLKIKHGEGNVKYKELEVTANAAEVGENSTKIEMQSIKDESRDEDLEVAINYRYLLDGLLGLEGERIKLKFNNIFWYPDYNKFDFVAVILHRGAEGDKKAIPLEDVELKGNYLIYFDTYIPLHRILEIRNKKTGEILYKKK